MCFITPPAAQRAPQCVVPQTETLDWPPTVEKSARDTEAAFTSPFFRCTHLFSIWSCAVKTPLQLCFGGSELSDLKNAQSFVPTDVSGFLAADHPGRSEAVFYLEDTKHEQKRPRGNVYMYCTLMN